MTRDYSTHTEADAGRHLDAYDGMSRYEAALERGYDPGEDYSPEPLSEESSALFARGKRVGFDAKNPMSAMHTEAVAEAWAILDGGWARALEALGLMAVGVGSHNLPRRSE